MYCFYGKTKSQKPVFLAPHPTSPPKQSGRPSSGRPPAQVSNLLIRFQDTIFLDAKLPVSLPTSPPRNPAPSLLHPPPPLRLRRVLRSPDGFLQMPGRLFPLPEGKQHAAVRAIGEGFGVELQGAGRPTQGLLQVGGVGGEFERIALRLLSKRLQAMLSAKSRIR